MFFCDNTGVIRGKCISIERYKHLFPGVYIVISSKIKKNLRKSIKKNILNALVLQTITKKYRKSGDYYFRFDARRAAILNSDKDYFLGTKVSAPLVKEMFQKKSHKLDNLLRFFRVVL